MSASVIDIKLKQSLKFPWEFVRGDMVQFFRLSQERLDEIVKSCESLGMSQNEAFNASELARTIVYGADVGKTDPNMRAFSGFIEWIESQEDGCYTVKFEGRTEPYTCLGFEQYECIR